MSNITDKVVVITGASSGIGESTAKLLAQQGARVVLGARRSNRIDAVVQEISAAGGRDLLNYCVDPVRTPCSQYNSCSLLCEKLRSAFPNAAAGAGDDYNFVGDV